MRRHAAAPLTVCACISLPTFAAAQDAPTDAPPAQDVVRADDAPRDAAENPAGATEVETPDSVAAQALDAAAAESAIEDVGDDASTDDDASFAERMLRRVEFHGFGDWNAGIVFADGEDLHYGYGESDLEMDTVEVSLRQFATITPEIRAVVGQSLFVQEGELTLELDVAAVDYQPTDTLSVRLGRTLSPVGLYTPVFRVGTVRPFAALPEAVYRAAGLLPQSYDGLEVRYATTTGRGTGIELSGMFGRALLTREDALSRVIEASQGYDEGSLDETKELDLMVGFNLRIDTSVDGLGFALGGMFGPAALATGWDIDPATGPTVGDAESHTILVAASAWLLRPRYELRGEFVLREDYNVEEGQSEQTIYGTYLEALVRPVEKLGIGLRASRYRETLDVPLPDALEPILHHNALAVSAGYWFSPDFVVRLEYQYVDGNRLLHVEDDEAYAVVEQWVTDVSVDPNTAEPFPHTGHFLGFNSAFSF